MNNDTSDFDHSYLQDDQDGNIDFAAVLAQHSGDDSMPAPAHPQHHQQNQGGQDVGQQASDTASAALAQYHTMTVPQPTEQSFMQGHSSDGGERPSTGSMDQGNGQQRQSSFSDLDFSTMKDSQSGANGESSPTGASVGMAGGPKPTVGSEEWHKVRRDNHKEVERRRRETINEGINELAKIVPGCEKNKGSILARAVQFITQLKENETQNIEKWTLEKLLTEQAIAELSSSCDKLKAECQRAWAECEQWKKAAQKVGASVDNDEKVDVDGDDAD